MEYWYPSQDFLNHRTLPSHGHLRVPLPIWPLDCLHPCCPKFFISPSPQPPCLGEKMDTYSAVLGGCFPIQLPTCRCKTCIRYIVATFQADSHPFFSLLYFKSFSILYTPGAGRTHGSDAHNYILFAFWAPCVTPFFKQDPFYHFLFTRQIVRARLVWSERIVSWSSQWTDQLRRLYCLKCVFWCVNLISRLSKNPWVLFSKDFLARFSLNPPGRIVTGASGSEFIELFVIFSSSDQTPPRYLGPTFSLLTHSVCLIHFLETHCTAFD